MNQTVIAGYAGLVSSAATSALSTLGATESWLSQHQFVVGLFVSLLFGVPSLIITIWGFILRKRELKIARRHNLDVSHLSDDALRTVKQFIKEIDSANQDRQTANATTS